MNKNYIISKIEELDHVEYDLFDDGTSTQHHCKIGFEGFKISLKMEKENLYGKNYFEEKSLYILISNSSECCESWGSLFLNDDINEFIGAEFYELKLMDDKKHIHDLTEKILNDKPELQDDEDELRGTSFVFVTLETSNGPFQLAVYNNHNGYYGHPVVIDFGNNTKIVKKI